MVEACRSAGQKNAARHRISVAGSGPGSDRDADRHIEGTTNRVRSRRAGNDPDAVNVGSELLIFVRGAAHSHSLSLSFVAGGPVSDGQVVESWPAGLVAERMAVARSGTPC
jgi:hypothetical protein